MELGKRNAGADSGTVTVCCRVLGLTGVFQTHCNQVYALRFYPNIRWMLLVNPGVLLLLYWVLAFETRYWFQTKVRLALEYSHVCLTYCQEFILFSNIYPPKVRLVSE